MGKRFEQTFHKRCNRDFPGGPVVKNLPFNAGDIGWIPGRGTKIPTRHRVTKPMHCNY